MEAFSEHLSFYLKPVKCFSNFGSSKMFRVHIYTMWLYLFHCTFFKFQIPIY